MAHVDVPESVPGILSLLSAFPETGEVLGAFTQQLLRGTSSLSAGERELIAAYVSRLNACRFCTWSHAAAARELAADVTVVDAVVDDADLSAVDAKMQALLRLAGAVQRGGDAVTPKDVERARDAGADDRAIHDTVLIAAAFCMFNRYVDGLDAWTPEDPGLYDDIGKRLAEHGYTLG